MNWRGFTPTKTSHEVVEILRALGHDVLTTHDAGRSNQSIKDDAVLRFAIETHRCVLTINRKDFQRLHRMMPAHPSVLALKYLCTSNAPEWRGASGVVRIELYRYLRSSTLASSSARRIEDYGAFAGRIDAAIRESGTLTYRLIKVVRG